MTTTTNIAQRVLNENGYMIDSSSVSITAQNILDENNWATSIIALDDLESLMNNAINYVNLEANTTIAPMSGTSGSKTINLSRSESFAIKLLTALIVRAYRDQGATTISGLSVSSVIADPQYTLFTDLVNKAIMKLKTINPTFVEYLIDNSILLINLHAETSISPLYGTVGTKSLSATDNQTIVVKLVASEFLQNHVKGKLSGFRLSETIRESINILKGYSFERT